MIARTIFVVDDEEIISSTLATILKLSGFDATAFTDPLAAIEAIQTTTPDLLITDVSMPEMNGIDLAIHFRTVCPSCTVLLFSGHATTSGLLVSAKEKGYDFNLLVKPVHPTDLLAVVRSL